MSFDLTLRLIEAMGVTPSGSTALVAIDTADDLAVAQHWTAATGNTLLAVHEGAVEVLRGRMADPIDALAPDRRPGHRLWLYTNFQCNLACDYCCVESSPRAAPRAFTVGDTELLVKEAAAAEVRELYVTGGEPFLLIDLDERLQIAIEHLPTTVLTNGMVWQGERLRRLARLPRDGLTLQISLDSATEVVHDRHRGAGSFQRAMRGIDTAIELGFHVRLAATIGSDGDASEDELFELFDRLGLREDQRVVRRVAKQGAATYGLSVSRASLIPEVCVTTEGVFWHPVAAIDPTMKVTDRWSPLDVAIQAVRDEYRQHRIRGDVLASSFPCA